MITANTHIAAMEPYALADLAAPPEKPLISLAQNESALPPSPSALESAHRALAEGRLYPDPDWTELRAAIAEVHGLAPKHILCGAGSMELIDCVIRCYAGPGASVVSTQTGYAFFRTATQAARADYAEAPSKDLTVDVDAILATASAETRIVCIANPGNPTGTRISRADVVRLRDGLGDDILLIVDEAYGEYSDDAPVFDLVERGNTVVMRTFSKAYALAGMRVGWGVFPPEVLTQVRKVLNPNNVSAASQAAATAAIADQEHMRAVCTRTIVLRERFAEQMRQLGLEVPQSHTNFVLLRFPAADAAARAERMLRAEGVILRPLAGYGLPDCLRATVGSAADMDFTAAVLGAWREKENG